ncbi:hypothetical protein [Flaviaesturariibacter aridisoli]|uniref:SdiA-regulated family protein n=1 Tax=Flaviaesturariibacter aridisoli TaxID=2545761 RepID=A0A4R4DV44_9BACT|nr:hypothetical protein [Flaviaesturariibacter aridisoli]TCZ67196.1 hypothetical protein E0486_16090 [Flaviaesturariibacter aridisoli]
MKRGDVIGIIAVLCVAAGLYFYYGKSKTSPAATVAALQSGSVHIKQRWDLPEALREVSAIAWAGNNRIACVQDNDGIIYFYDIGAGKVADQFTFAGKGDFEGLAIAGNTYYVLRSDGMLFEITRGAGKPEVRTYQGPFSNHNDCESLSYDAARNRLLIGVKEADLSDASRKGVYPFDLATKQFSTEAAYYIASDNAAPASGKKGKKKKAGTIRPSDNVLIPGGQGLYVLDGPRSELLVTDARGNVERVIELDKSVFPQPEGLCFSPGGELYLSSEAGKKGTATLARVKLD